jgi:hypothetical protein
VVKQHRITQHYLDTTIVPKPSHDGDLNKIVPSSALLVKMQSCLVQNILKT